MKLVACLPLASLVFLAGCAAPSTRLDNPERFVVRAEGKVRADKAQAMTDCVEDGLNTSLTGVTKSTVRRTRREGMSRVETVSAPYLLVSADIEDSGEARLLEGPAAAMFSTSSEIEAFKACLSRFAAR